MKISSVSQAYKDIADKAEPYYDTKYRLDLITEAQKEVFLFVCLFCFGSSICWLF
jgi:hypothetical protein